MGTLTLGSLFDGSGGFPLGGILAGIKPVWQSEIEPFPIRVTTKRLPFVKHYGDVSKLDGGELEPVDIITFGSPCFPEETLVLTENGYIPIPEVEVGMKVLTHKGRWRKVTAAGSKFGETVILRGNHYGLECTPNHPIYSSGEKKYSPTLENGKRACRILLTDEKSWVPAEGMKGKLWAIPRFTEALPVKSPADTYSARYKRMPELSEDLFYFVGRWLGDGWLRDGQRPGRPTGQTWGQIFLCDSFDKEKELTDCVSKISDRYFVRKERTAVRVCFTSHVLCDWLRDNFGEYSYGKTMPGWVFGLPEEYRQSLLQGLLDSDGYKVKDKICTWKIQTVSKKLAESIRLLAEIQGYSTTVHKIVMPQKTIIEGRVVRQRDSYSVVITQKGKRGHFTDDLHGWYRVRDVRSTGHTKPVYNLTVEEDNSYVADGVLVHNCQDMSIAGKRDGLDGERSGLFHQAVRIIKEMREKTNARYPRFIVWENVPGAFSSHGGDDFQKVLEEICGICDDSVSVPGSAKWEPAGCILGDGFSVAWRVLDADAWGVPQRRKRIYLVGHLTGRCAGKILFESEGVSGYSAAGFRSWQRTACHTEGGAGEAGGTICLNDQGGIVMSVTEDVTCTLRAEAHHPPVVMSAGFCTEHSAKARNIGYEAETAPTLRAGVVPATVYENHSQDTRYSGPVETAPTVLSTYGTGGNNQPFVVEREAFGICSKDSNSMKSDNPKSGFYDAETSRTLDANGGNPTCNQGGIAVVETVKTFDVRQSSDGTQNMRNHAYESDTCRTVDRGGNMPGSNQGGIAVVSIQGSMIGRKEENGPQGSGIAEEVSFTLNTVDRHAVAYSSSKASYHTRFEKNLSPTLVASDYKDPVTVSFGIGRDAYNMGKNAKFGMQVEEELQPTLTARGPGAVGLYYTVRRLTPTECARLQGFPDWWCSNLETPDPTDEEIRFWMDVFETHRRVMGTAKKARTRNQVIKWLKNPHTDSAEYKMWGNGVALPCVFFVLAGIAYFADK